MSNKTSTSRSQPTPRAAEIVREYGPFPGTDTVHGVTHDGRRVWAATGASLIAFDPESGDSPWIGATYRYNVSVQYRVDDHSRLSLSVVNLFNKMPPKDATYTSYAYYDVSWFDTVGRQLNLQFTHKFGGTAL